jgi:hypothetical protein
MQLHENPKRAEERNFPLQGSSAKLARTMRAICEDGTLARKPFGGGKSSATNFAVIARLAASAKATASHGEKASAKPLA